MRFNKFKLITASTLLLLGSQSGTVLAEDNAASQQAGQATSSAQAPANAQAQANTQQAQSNTAQAPQPAYRGNPYPRYNRGYNRPFGSSGPSFRGPWNRGSGFGFSNNDGPGWGSAPSFGSWGDRDRGYYDRGPGFRGPWDSGRGSGFGFGSNDGPGWDSGPRYDRGPRYQPWDDRGRGYYDRGPDFRGPWNNGNGSGMGFGW